ncbi:hypothetical protein GKODMF_14445 [Candidatus Electrothrix gigas]
MKRNGTKKAVRKTVTVQKNDKQRKRFRTEIKAGYFWNPNEISTLSCGSC